MEAFTGIMSRESSVCMLIGLMVISAVWLYGFAGKSWAGLSGQFTRT